MRTVTGGRRGVAVGTVFSVVLALALRVALSGQALGAHVVAGPSFAPGAPVDSVQPAGWLVAQKLQRPPRIDGTLSPGEWDEAGRVSGFTQIEPKAGEAMTERTEVWVARDDENLYLAFVAYDSEMSRVRTELTPRDGFTDAADAVGLAIDPYGTGSRGYQFLFSPAGVQTDGIGGGSPDFTWDGVLTSRASVQSDRWIVEAAIPFATILTGGRSQADWSLNFVRQIPRKGEVGWWYPVPRGGTWELYEHMGLLMGMNGVRAGTRLEAIPTATTQVRGGDATGKTDASWGATLRMPLSPTLRVEGTFRPDFSTVESDEAQVGFNERFALFYPEKRPFFLESGDEFRTPAMSVISAPIELLYTRTFVRPRLGARLLATPPGGFVGAMLIQDETPEGGLGAMGGVVRAKIERPGGVQAGILATRLDDHGRHNTVVATDANLRLPSATTLTLQLAGSVSDSSAAGTTSRGMAAYVDLARETGDNFEQIVYRRVDPEFDTRVGYAPRVDLQQVIAHGGFFLRRHRGPLLNAQPMFQYALTLDAAGRRTETEYLPHMSFVLTRGTVAVIGYRFGRERYRTREYDQARAELKLRTTPMPWLSLSTVAKQGRRVRYDLDPSSSDLTFVAPLDEISGTSELRLGKRASLSMAVTWQRLGGQGSLEPTTVWLGRLEVFYHTTANSYVRTIAQYDPAGHVRDLSALAALELNYGTQLDVGADYSSRDGLSGGREVRHALFIRISYLIRR